MDRNNNLDFFLDRIIDHNSGNLNSPIAFTLSLIGENIDNEYAQVDRYDLESTQHGQKDKIRQLINAYKKSENIEDFTHLNSSLRRILSDKEFINETFGIFIITDGQLKAGDINEVGLKDQYGGIQPSIEEYLESVQDNLLKLKNLHKPVFIIQSSPLPVNDFLPFKKHFTHGANFISSDDFFWVDGQKDLGSNDYQEIDSAYNQFLIGAQSLIINSGYPVIRSNDKNIIENSLRYTSLSQQFSHIQKEMAAESKKATTLYEKDAELVKLLNDFESLGDQLDTLSGSVSQAEIHRIANQIDNLIASDLNLKKVDSALQVIMRSNYTYVPIYAVDTYPKLSETDIITNEQPRDWNSLQESIILGLTNYLIERSENEVIFILIDVLREEIFVKNEYLRETLFYHLAHLLDNHTENLSLILVKEAIVSDLDKFPQNLLKHPKIKADEALIALQFAIQLFETMSTQGNLEDAFKKANQIIKEQGLIDNSKPLGVALLFTTELAMYMEDHDLIKAFKEMDLEKLTLFTKIITISFANSNSQLPVQNIELITGKLIKFYEQYEQVKNQVEHLNKELEQLVNFKNDLGAFLAYRENLTLTVIKSATQLFVQGSELIAHFNMQSNCDILNQEISKVQRIVETTIEAYFRIRKEDYSKAFALLMPILPDLLPNTSEYNKKFNRRVKQLMAIAGEVSEANSADDIKNLIHQHALPVASYRIKRDNIENNLMINAYFGGSAAYYTSDNDFSPVISAPIGIDWSFGTKKRKQSWSIFIPILDIGNVINYRFSEGESGDEIRFNQIISPGLMVSYGLSKRFPFSINAGGQINPKRLLLGIALDLPLLRIK
ncbi:hypothetical protein [Fulvivirga lutimaris]|uniref:hypothetical protein n=1 Tax=Fulvivirga lutimaris TaxID=1819566 RepID=UPI0012BC1801|nr:hypothetical protein [Fulvivirga lutimaris]MTI41672.1 hypothetical protein [Fulvivirga lutimaris]